MERFWGFIVAAALLVPAGHARAETVHFEELAREASRIDSAEQLASLFWSRLSSCKDAGSDLERRRCEGLRAARERQVAGRTFVVTGGAGSLLGGAFDEEKKAVPLKLTTCIACEQPLKVAGEEFFVVAEGGKVAAGDSGIEGSGLHTASRSFKNESWAKRWAEEALPRLRAEYLVQIPARPKAWSGSGAKAYRVKVLGFRFYDPCDGKIIGAEPASNPVRADKSTCGETVADKPGEPEKAPEPEKPAEPKLPAELSVRMISTAMAPARKAAEKCFETFGVPGNASFRITIDNQGTVLGVEQKGDFVDTPTGTCLEKAVKASTFPATSKARTTVNYPFMLR